MARTIQSGLLLAVLLKIVFVFGNGVITSLPDQVWNHIGPDHFGLIAPASALWGRKLLLSGGSDGFNNKSEIWGYQLNEGDTWTITPESMENMFFTRSHHTSNVYRDYLFTFGGKDSDGLEVQQLIDGDEHIVYQGPGPHKRVGHTAVLRDEDLYVYGGFDLQHKTYSSALWRANLRYGELDWELIQLESPAGARAGHSAILYQDSLYIFGGQNEEGYLSDLWRYDFITGDWIRCYMWSDNSYFPSPRIGHVAVYWSDEGMYIWGGYGEDGFYNDMWRFDLQEETWERIFEGTVAGYQSNSFELPSPRAFTGYTVFEGKLVVLGGQVTMGGLKEVFWSPNTRYVPIEYEDDFAGDVWEYDFCSKSWKFVGCLAPWAESNITSPADCRSQFQPECLNDCSGNGVCIRDDVCVCRGEWVGEDCSYNTCFEDPYLGYDIDLLDRILISESILNIGNRLKKLKAKLEYIEKALPPYEEFISCVKFNPKIGDLLEDQATTDGLAFNDDLQSSLVPIVKEFNQVLDNTHDGEELQIFPL